MPLLTLPLALVALAALPALASIYWLRNRYRRRTVSSLLLWTDQRQAREGGLRVERFQMPLTFLLELLVLALLVVAATDPRVEVDEARRPLAVVLDDSYSMLAGSEDSAHARALEALREQLAGEGDTPVTLIAAGPTPQVLGTVDPRQAESYLAQWRCQATASDLARAIALAGEISRGRARVLVLTDHAPQGDVDAGRVQWWAFGQARGNVAFVNAVRSSEDDRVLLEIANLSDQPASTVLTIDSATRDLRLEARQRQRLWVQAQAGQSLHAYLSDDALESDNHVELLPQVREPVRVRMDVENPVLDRAMRMALEASRQVEFVMSGPDLIVTDQDDQAASEPGPWVVRFVEQTDDPVAYVGPFVLDRAHPLTRGLSLTGTIWAAGTSGSTGTAPAGRPVVMAGNETLISEVSFAQDRRELVIRLRPALSTLLSTPDFPIMIWNLLEWRRAHRPGLERANVRVGMDVRLALPTDVEAVRLVSPTGEAQTLNAMDRAVSLQAQTAGLYQVTADEAGYWTFVANVLAPRESDVSTTGQGRWGQWIDVAALRREYRSIAWALLLPAVAAMLLHGYLVHRAGRMPA